MKKIITLTFIAATASACGSNQNCNIPCPDQIPYKLTESYTYTNSPDDICTFKSLGFFETSGEQCNFLFPNFETDLICVEIGDCQKTDFTKIFIAWNIGDIYLCDGEVQNDGIHLRCIKNPETENSVDCQEAIFTKNE